MTLALTPCVSRVCSLLCRSKRQVLLDPVVPGFAEDTIFAYLEREGDPLLIEFLQMPEAGPGTS